MPQHRSAAGTRRDGCWYGCGKASHQVGKALGHMAATHRADDSTAIAKPIRRAKHRLDEMAGLVEPRPQQRHRLRTA
jgi:hypothetical protein